MKSLSCLLRNWFWFFETKFRVTQADPKLAMQPKSIFLLPPPQCWDYRHVPTVHSWEIRFAVNQLIHQLRVRFRLMLLAHLSWAICTLYSFLDPILSKPEGQGRGRRGSQKGAVRSEVSLHGSSVVLNVFNHTRSLKCSLQSHA